MANQYKQPDSVDEYLNDARTGHTAPFHTSHGMRHDTTGRKGQTILATGAVNNVGRSCFNVENSLLDEKFGGGVNFNDVDVLERDTARSQGHEDPYHPGRALHVADEVGRRGVQRETMNQRADREDAERARSFAASRFINRLPPLGE
jgi:hypothetical protein